MKNNNMDVLIIFKIINFVITQCIKMISDDTQQLN
jgi:hypothetical protein